MRRIVRAAKEIIRLTFARERLGDDAHGGAGPARRAPGRFLRMLFAVEPLPLDPPAPARPRLRLGRLLAPEPLPEDPVLPPRRRSGGLAALFAPESLDDP